MDKKISLALWWWASRWFIHIGVLKYLEENDYKIIEISGTSMWAIIASLVALWKNWEEIKSLAETLDYKKLIDVDLSFWLIKWKKIEKKLYEIFWDIKIEDLKIPLKIVATNINSWEKEVFSKWLITDALRASISLPWIFKPHKIWKNHYVDGGVCNNLPVDVLEWKNIVWVSALKLIYWPFDTKTKFLWLELDASFLKVWYQIIHRSILLMMKQNEDNSIKVLNKNWILIKVDFWDLDYYHFDKLEEFISLGYNEAKKKLR